MQIVVASFNPVKINATRQAFATLFPDTALEMATGALLGAAGRLPTAGRIALAVECGIQNSALGITVAVSLLSISGLAVPSVIYAILMNITALVLVLIRQLQVSRAASSGAYP